MPGYTPELIEISKNQTRCSECPIRHQTLFQGVKKEDLNLVQSYRTGQYRLKARQEIFLEAQNSQYLFSIYHGWCAIYKSLGNGKKQIIKIALPGDLIGFQSNSEAPLNYSAISLTDMVLCAFPRNEFTGLLNRNAFVLKRLMELNAREMNLCQNHLMAIGKNIAIEKISLFCAELFLRFHNIYQLPLTNRIFFPLTQVEIGDATGLTCVHVNRTLKTLSDMNLMDISARTLTVPDIDKLCKLGQFDAKSIHTYTLY